MMTKAADYSKTRAPDGFCPLGALLLKIGILSRIIFVIRNNISLPLFAGMADFL